MQPLNRARRRAVRAVLSALAGGGLTAAGLAGPLAGGAIAATGSGTPVSPEGSSPATEAGGVTQETETGTTSTSTATKPSLTTTPMVSSTAPTTSAPTSNITTTAAAPTTTAAQPDTATPSAADAPAVVLQRKQKVSPSTPANPAQTTTSEQTGQSEKPAKRAKANKKASGPNNVALSPQLVAAEAGQLVAMLASAEASDQSLGFYRIPLFLLPIYKAAAVQYGVPWQILAAINEIETDYGTDLSVSTAGAVGWMQFMPSTWLQYGVDALNAGYADPYNPVDAIFAAARYLRAAGAATDLRAAILSYNHSEEYVESVVLRAKLISTYPKGVIATLTGLIDGRLPVTGKKVAWGSLSALGTSSATASAAAASPRAAASGAAPPVAPAATSAAASAPSPAAAASSAHAAAKPPAPLQLVDLMSAPNAEVVAAQDGRIVRLGHSKQLGNYVILRDVYGDVFTYAGLGSIASHYPKPKAPSATASTALPSLPTASKGEAKPKLAATAGTHPPVTLKVKTHSPKS